MSKEYNFDTDDIITLKDDELYYVTGVIHDSQRLFITPVEGKEFEVKFSEVCKQWTLVK